MAMSTTTNSFVWPSDYNWRAAHNEPNATTFAHQSNFNKDFYLPWLMTVWMLSTSKPETQLRPNTRGVKNYKRVKNNPSPPPPPQPHKINPFIHHHDPFGGGSHKATKDYTNTGRTVLKDSTNTGKTAIKDFTNIGRPFFYGTGRSRPSDDYFSEIFSWNKIEIEFLREEHRRSAIASKRYIAENQLPLGIEIWKDRIFLTLPKWRPGIPVTLTSVRRDDKGLRLPSSPILEPYPDWSWFDDTGSGSETSVDCDRIVSAFRMITDECGRLWVIDSGAIDIANNQTQICPAKLLVFDLLSDELLHKYFFPSEQIYDGTLLSYITVDVRQDCSEAFAFVADVFRYGLLVYSLEKNKSWRIGHSYFYPDPLLSHYSIDGIRFQWVDGIFSLALSPIDPVTSDRYLYFHALSSNREFRVPVSRIINETLAGDSAEFFEVVGEPRGGTKHQSSGSVMDSQGVLYYNLPSLKAVGCWNSLSYEHDEYSQGIIAISNKSLSFANDIKLDKSTGAHSDTYTNTGDDGFDSDSAAPFSRSRPWRLYVISNKLHQYLYGGLDPKGPNYIVTSIDTRNAIMNTVCEPRYNIGT